MDDVRVLQKGGQGILNPLAVKEQAPPPFITFDRTWIKFKCSFFCSIKFNLFKCFHKKTKNILADTLAVRENALL